MKNIISKLKDKKRLVRTSLTSAMVLGSASMCFATTGANTGNADLDTMIGSMTSGLDSIKIGGLYIVGAIILVAVVFLGGRWLWNLFRGWLAKAA